MLRAVEGFLRGALSSQGQSPFKWDIMLQPAILDKLVLTASFTAEQASPAGLESFISCAASMLKLAASGEYSSGEAAWRLRWLVAAAAAASLQRSSSAGILSAAAAGGGSSSSLPGSSARAAGISSTSSSSNSTAYSAMLVLLGRCMLQCAFELYQFSKTGDWVAQAQQLLATIRAGYLLTIPLPDVNDLLLGPASAETACFSSFASQPPAMQRLLASLQALLMPGSQLA